MSESVETHAIDCDEETFWRIYLSHEYGHGLFVDCLGFISATIDTIGGDITSRFERSVRTVCILDVPGPLKPLLGAKITAVEHGIYDAASRTYSYEIEDQRLKDKFEIAGWISTTPRAGGGISQNTRTVVKAKVPFVGGALERYFMRENARFWRESTEFTVIV